MAAVIATVFWYRHMHRGDAASFRMPLYPFLPLLFLVAVLWIVGVTIWDHPGDAGMGALITVAGLPVYFVWRYMLGRRRASV
jgi:APA family basic amino acid/polyamine antiporter